MTDKQIEFVEKHIPVKYSWTWEFDQTKEIYWLWLKKKREHHITMKDWYSTKTKYGGQIGFHYLQHRGRTIESLNDYLFIASESNGLTALGQLLFQQSIESFVYSVLGSQASTRWAIVDEGTKSLQTQVVFHKIVNDTDRR